MGVTGLWQVIQPCARPTNLATLNRQRLAVDASIWIYQFLKAMRDKDGNAMHNGHIVGFFRRICKLLYYGILPVFVFDGGAPALKRMTIQGRKRRREGRRDDAARTAGKLLAVQMQRLADEEEKRRKRKKVAFSTGTEDTFVPRDDEGEEALPDANQMVYVEEIGMNQRERLQSRRFQKQDAYHLPELPGGIETMGRPEDPRIMSVEELEEYARQFNSGEDVNLYDFSKIDFDGDFFKSLPPADRYNILNAARLRSRLRMGISKDQLDDMFPNRMEFSKFQIERVKERNRLTQRLMYEIGMTGTDLTIGANGVNSGRIAGDKDREYILVKNEGAEGGWALGVVSKNKDVGKISNPIDVDQIDVQFQKKEEEFDSDEDEDFEDVPIEGVNRLPKPRPGWRPTDYMAEQAKAMGASIHELYGIVKEDDDSLFVQDNSTGGADSLFGNQQEQDQLQEDEDEDLNRAIAMSLDSQFGLGQDSQPNEERERGPAPEWKQRAAPITKPIKSSTTSGSMIAHIVNSKALSEVRASEAAKAKAQVSRDDGNSSDSDIDFGAALAADAKRRKTQHPGQAGSSGPLPFESLEWRKPAAQKPKELEVTKDSLPEASHPKPSGPNEAEMAAFEVDSEEDEMAGGFVKPRSPRENKGGTEVLPWRPSDDEPLPLPPWLSGNADVLEGLKASRAAETRQAAEHDEYLEQQTALRRKQRLDETIQIQSSDDDSDVEIVEAPPRPKGETPADKSKDSGREVHETAREVQILAFHDKSQEPESSNPITAEEDIVMVEKEETGTTAEEENDQQKVSETQPEEEEEDIEFEDVEMPPAEAAQNTAPSPGRDGSPDIFAGVQPEPQPVAQTQPQVPTQDEEDIFAGLDAPTNPAPELESDPEEEELLLQLAQEAEAHATFASTIKLPPQARPLASSTAFFPDRAALEKEIASLQKQKEKEQRDSDEVTQIMVAEVQSLLRLFGIPYLTAPMEAEAQCAELVRLGLVDGIVTDDSDVFLFGGTRVYKNMFNGNKFVECYLARDLEGELSLGREALISLAQLLGSDYAEGLPGVGPVTAVELLAEFPGGGEGLERFKTWWEGVQAKGTLAEGDKGNKFRKKFRRAHGKKLFLPPGFPSGAVVEAYMRPMVDESAEDFVWGVPDLEGLRRFLVGTVGWGPEQTDEVLVPVVRDMNKRAAEGTQSNITRFFGLAPGTGGEGLDQGAGGEAFAPRQRAKTSKRMAEAVGKLRARKGGSGAVDGGTEEGGNGETDNEEAPGRKRKAKGTFVTTIDRSEANENSDEEYHVGDGGDEEITSTAGSKRRGRKRAKP